MLIGLRWLNEFLSPAVTADEAEHVLTHAGFPVESVRAGDDGDTLLDTEVTSNRGDCLCHLGMAREVAACTGRALREPARPAPARHGYAPRLLTLRNQTPDACPTFIAQVISGVRVGPSPAWLARDLAGVGQRSINNVVDVTNWLNLAIGQPAHVFDLDRLAGRSLVVRFAADGERLTTLDGRARTLAATDLVVADADRPQSLAGVIGGSDSEVTAASTDIVLETAAWDPPVVRRAARRHGIRTDASHRFERLVNPATVEPAAILAAALIVEVAGGTLLGGDNGGLLTDGRPIPADPVILLRPERVTGLIGVDITAGEIIHLLRSLGLDVAQRNERELACTPPPWRPDLTREADLIEEVARVTGLERIPAPEAVTITLRPPQRSELAGRAIADVLAGLGFFETVTFSFCRPDRADLFKPADASVILVNDDRRGDEPALRPSVLAGLLAARKANQDAQNAPPGGVRLFESAAAFGHPVAAGAASESRRLALVMDAPLAQRGRAPTIEARQHAVSAVRGAVEAALRAAAGPATPVVVSPSAPPSAAWDAEACGAVLLAGRAIGHLGLASPAALQLYGLELPVAMAEIDLAAVHEHPPAVTPPPTLPEFPAIERDLSVVVDEATRWDELSAAVSGAGVDRLESVAFVGAYRGPQVGPGRKSVTLRMTFRDRSRTLRHAEVDPQVASVVGLLARGFGAELRA